MVDFHKHNKIDSPAINGGDLENAPQSAITPITDTPDGTYSSNEQTMLNNLKTAVNDIITKLQALNLTK